jgi:RecA-family ATPase
MTDTKDSDNEKGSMTADELLADIRKSDPDYMPKNVVRIKPLADAKNIVPIPLGDLKAIIPSPIEYICYPCLPTQGLGFIYAASGVGKTLFSLNLSYSIAQGGNFLKYSCPKPRKVLYIDAEMAFNQIHNRLLKIIEIQGELDNPQNFSLLTPDKVLPFRMPKIDNPADQKIYEEIIAIGEYEVIVFDNLSMLSSFDENKSNEWIIVQDWLLKLRSFGKTVIIIHHAGKDKSGYRGTSRMLDCMDVAISLQPVKLEETEEDSHIKKFKIVYEKHRIFEGMEVLPFEVTLENFKWNYQSMEKSNIEKVVEMIKAKMSQREIARELLIPQTSVCRLVKKAKEKGLLNY